jgi:predicted transcriptional regulator
MENTGKTENSFTIIVFDEVFISCLYVVCVESVSRLLVVSIILKDSSRGYGLYQIRSQLESHLTASEINKYLVEMTQHGLISPVRGGFNYEMTPKGAHFLKVYNELLKETPDGRIGNCTGLFSLFSLLCEFGSKLKNRFFYRSELS